MVMSTCPCSELWYMASLRALSLAFPVRIRSIWEGLLPSSSEPSARISSRDKTSPLPFSVWDSSLRKTFLKGQKHRNKKEISVYWSVQNVGLLIAFYLGVCLLSNITTNDKQVHLYYNAHFCVFIKWYDKHWVLVITDGNWWLCLLHLARTAR